MILRSTIAAFALVLMSAAAAAQDGPNGWFLDRMAVEDRVDVWLAFHRVPDGRPVFMLNCQTGWPEVLVTVYLDADSGAPGELVLAGNAGQQAL